jgi:hypothetical protein
MFSRGLMAVVKTTAEAIVKNAALKYIEDGLMVSDICELEKKYPKKVTTQKLWALYHNITSVN